MENSIKASLEALLFYHGEPLEIKKISKLLGVSKDECEHALHEWNESLAADPHRGLILLWKDDKVQLGTKKEFQDIGKKLIEEEFREELTPATLETLSLIAYLGPVPRATIDYVRGVNSSFTIRNLLVRGLIERTQDPKHMGRYQYSATFDFLKHLGLSRVEELPEYQKFREVLKQFEEQGESKTESASVSPTVS